MGLLGTWAGALIVVILICAILGGVYTAFVRLTDKNTMIDSGLLHGRMGVFGTLSLALLLVLGDEVKLNIMPALSGFVFTVIAGVVLYFLIRRKGVLPISVILIHALLAVVSLLFLVGLFKFT